MPTILWADNDLDYLGTQAERLGKHYQVTPVSSPHEVRECLRAKHCDLAILDLRLTNDDDERDTSGLDIAKELEFRYVPKIVLTGYESFAAARDALGSALDGVPPPVAFVLKSEIEADNGWERFLGILDRAFDSGPGWLRDVISHTVQDLRLDYDSARDQSDRNFKLSWIVALVGAAIVFASIGLMLSQVFVGTAGTLGILAGIVTDAVALLFFTRVDKANKRMDSYHAESLQARNFEKLLAACEDLPSKKRNTSREEIIRASLNCWLAAPEPHKRPAKES